MKEIFLAKKIKQDEKGITLIALVVTIVVLLILAAVSIPMLGGENGIITQAIESKDKTKVGDEKERVGLAATAAKTETGWGEITEDNLEAELTKNIGARDVDYTLTLSGDKFKVTYKDTGNSYLVDKDGNTTECGPWYTEPGTDVDGNKTLKVTNGKITLEVGDIIDYNSNDSGEKTYTSKTIDTGDSADQIFSSKYEGTWKVLGVSDEGQILITSTDVIKTTASGGYYWLSGQDGYKNAVSELDKISEIFGYGDGAVGARSITVEDVNKVTGYNPNNVGVYDPNQTGSGTKYGTGSLNEYGNDVTYYWKGDNYPYYTYKKSDGTVVTPGNLSSSHSTAFYWFDINEKTWKSSPKSTTATTSNMEKITTLRSNYYYYYPQTLTNTSDTTATEGLTTSSKAYKAIFCNSSESTSGHYYWLGSPYVDTDTRRADFGVRIVSDGYVSSNSLYGSNSSAGIAYREVRPVVILKSSIQLTGSSTDGWTIVKN